MATFALSSLLSTRSKRTDMANQSQICDRLFGMKQLADNAAMNAR